MGSEPGFAAASKWLCNSLRMAAKIQHSRASFSKTMYVTDLRQVHVLYVLMPRLPPECCKAYHAMHMPASRSEPCFLLSTCTTNFGSRELCKTSVDSMHAVPVMSIMLVMPVMPVG